MDKFQMIPGEGVRAEFLRYTVFAGNEKMMQSHHVIFPDAVHLEVEKYLVEGCTVIYVAVTDQAAGYVELTDTIREESENTVKELNRLGVTPVLLTGDNPGVAGNLGRNLGITAIHANCLPEDKLAFVKIYLPPIRANCIIYLAKYMGKCYNVYNVSFNR